MTELEDVAQMIAEAEVRARAAFEKLTDEDWEVMRRVCAEVTEKIQRMTPEEFETAAKEALHFFRP